MIIEINVDESLFEAPVRAAVGREVNRVVDSLVQRKIAEYTNKIEEAVEVHLAKRLTDEHIKSVIDTAVKEIIERRLDEV